MFGNKKQYLLHDSSGTFESGRLILVRYSEATPSEEFNQAVDALALCVSVLVRPETKHIRGGGKDKDCLSFCKVPDERNSLDCYSETCFVARVVRVKVSYAIAVTCTVYFIVDFHPGSCIARNRDNE